VQLCFSCRASVFESLAAGEISRLKLVYQPVAPLVERSGRKRVRNYIDRITSEATTEAHHLCCANYALRDRGDYYHLKDR
jgi:hypothetical protein